MICLTKTKCHLIDKHNINEYECFFFLCPKIPTHKYGSVHGICIFVKEDIVINGLSIDTLCSQTIIWLPKQSLGYDCIIGAVYIYIYI